MFSYKVHLRQTVFGLQSYGISGYFPYVEPHYFLDLRASLKLILNLVNSLLKPRFLKISLKIRPCPQICAFV